MTETGPETISWLRVIIAFGTVFGLLGLLSYSLKYISLKGMKFPGLAQGTNRIQILESLTLDVRRRLVIIRCDEVEHLLLLGVNQDIVIESKPSSKLLSPDPLSPTPGFHKNLP